MDDVSGDPSYWTGWGPVWDSHDWTPHPLAWDGAICSRCGIKASNAEISRGDTPACNKIVVHNGQERLFSDDDPGGEHHD